MHFCVLMNNYTKIRRWFKIFPNSLNLLSQTKFFKVKWQQMDVFCFSSRLHLVQLCRVIFRIFEGHVRLHGSILLLSSTHWVTVFYISHDMNIDMSYTRVILLFVSLLFINTSPITFLSIYVISFGLDVLDGPVARAYGQTSHFG